MKRSEIIKQLEEAISPCNSTYKKHREECAKRVLDLVEQYMVPNKRLEEYQTKLLDNGYMIDGITGRYVYSWEEEDEKA